MKNILHNLYCRCFPDYPTTAEIFYDLLDPQTAHTVYAYEGGEVIGYSMLRDNCIKLLIVEPEHRGKGHGSALLKQSEDYIKNAGHSEIILGGTGDRMFQGVPCDTDNNAVEFFKKRGYYAEWTSFNMTLPLEKFDISKLDITPPNGITFRFATAEDKPQLLKAVEDADDGWLELFEELEAPVMLAVEGHEIMGFQIVSTDDFRFTYNDCIIGCVGVVQKARNRGIGLAMVVEGVDWLKKQGCKSIELLYTYDELVKWYGKIGFIVNSKQWMGEKQ
ncbi:MAG: GNAT family N-acetyltransferase [Oscillospiraceae bacterium]|nr:GNAT family N-acetyltransferase [Oscillospiraceae bacterium]